MLLLANKDILYMRKVTLNKTMVSQSAKTGSGPFPAVFFMASRCFLETFLLLIYCCYETQFQANILKEEVALC